MSRFDVVVCGGGVAGIEAVLRLRAIVGARVPITLIAPGPVFSYRPLAVREPFGLPGAQHYPLREITTDLGVRWIRSRLRAVDVSRRTIHTDSGVTLEYDALLLATGARETTPYPHALTFSDATASTTVRSLVTNIENGQVASVAFVVPREWTWPAPLYELALLTAQHARATNRTPQITFITPEPRPLTVFGPATAEVIRRRLETAHIALHTSATARVPAPGVVELDDARLSVDHVVTVPKLTGQPIDGLPAGTRWSVPINEWCVVPASTGRVFAAGDATDYPVKQGGISAQQADTAAMAIAHLAGLADRPPPLKPIIRGTLLAGGRPLYATHHPVRGPDLKSEIFERPEWAADEKIIARELGPYLRRLRAPT